jgi:LysM repeat protein/tetratricopeptide (TPR) repeat protein
MSKKVRIILVFILIISGYFPLFGNDLSSLLIGKNKKNDTCFADYSKYHHLLQNIIHKIEKRPTDNYLYILPIYNLVTPVYPYSKEWQILNNIIVRASDEINQAEYKDETYCNLLPQIYMLRGQASFYLQKYRDANDDFAYLMNSFPQTDIGYDAMVWLAHSFLSLEKYEDAEAILWKCVEVRTAFNSTISAHYEAVATDFYVKIMENDLAILHLQEAIRLPLNKILKTRAFFVMGQLYDNMGKYQQAASYYDSLLRQSAATDMMKPYAQVYKNLCMRKIEKEYHDSVTKAVWLQAQVSPTYFEPTMVESNHDSMAFWQDYPYYFSDDATMFFLDESFEQEEQFDNQFIIDFDLDEPISETLLDSIFENWDSISTSLPNPEVRNMKDTIYLPLHTPGVAYTFPPINPVFSRFGYRRTRYHYGVDTRNKMGDSIFCVFDGVVRVAKRSKSYGNVVVVRHLNGLETLYAHCSKVLVSHNQAVRAGDLIALVGSTGRSSGPHLHIETRYKGVAFNPEYLIDFDKSKLVSDTLMITKELFNLKKKPANASASSSMVASATKSTSSVSNTHSSSDTFTYYSVKAGDTLSAIARRNGTSVDKIKKVNGLDSDLIRIGQKLKIM